jgi:hypothetical protein
MISAPLVGSDEGAAMFRDERFDSHGRLTANLLHLGFRSSTT